MFSRPYMQASARSRPTAKTPVRRELPRWMRWLDWSLSAAVVGGLTFCWGGGYNALEDWTTTHALVELDAPQPVPVPELRLTARDREQINCLATNAWQEAANQGEAGMRAVAAVTMNRLFDGRYGRTVCDVVTAHWRVAERGRDGHVVSYRTHWEFSWLGLPHREPSGPTWRDAQRVAAQVYLRGDTVRDDTRGAKYYLNPALTPLRRDPGAVSAVIGDHTFYTN